MTTICDGCGKSVDADKVNSLTMNQPGRRWRRDYCGSCWAQILAAMDSLGGKVQ